MRDSFYFGGTLDEFETQLAVFADQLVALRDYQLHYEKERITGGYWKFHLMLRDPRAEAAWLASTFDWAHGALPEPPRFEATLAAEYQQDQVHVRGDWSDRDAPNMQPVFEALKAHLDARGRLAAEGRTSTEADKSMEPESAMPEGTAQRGIKIGTAARVWEYHRAMKEGLSNRAAKARSHCDPSTYYRRCKEVTGEDPIEPYR